MNVAERRYPNGRVTLSLTHTRVVSECRSERGLRKGRLRLPYDMMLEAPRDVERMTRAGDRKRRIQEKQRALALKHERELRAQKARTQLPPEPARSKSVQVPRESRDSLLLLSRSMVSLISDMFAILKKDGPQFISTSELRRLQLLSDSFVQLNHLIVHSPLVPSVVSNLFDRLITQTSSFLGLVRDASFRRRFIQSVESEDIGLPIQILHQVGPFVSLVKYRDQVLRDLGVVSELQKFPVPEETVVIDPRRRGPTTVPQYRR